MNPKQERFAREYVIDHNATKAAIRAGYSKKTARSLGQRLLTFVDIKRLIEKLDADVAGKLGITQEYVLQGVQEITERCMQRVPVMVRDPKDGRRFVQDTNADGEGVWQFDSRGAAKGFEMMGRYLRMWAAEDGPQNAGGGFHVHVHPGAKK